MTIGTLPLIWVCRMEEVKGAGILSLFQRDEIELFSTVRVGRMVETCTAMGALAFLIDASEKWRLTWSRWCCQGQWFKMKDEPRRLSALCCRGLFLGCKLSQIKDRTRRDESAGSATPSQLQLKFS